MLKVLSGNKAAAYAAKLAKVEVAAVYPITPQTQISEEVSKFVADGKLDCDIIEVEGEHSVMSAITGAAVAGARVFTATSSLGLAYMNEPMMFAAGMRVPMVMVDVTRELSAVSVPAVRMLPPPETAAGWKSTPQILRNSLTPSSWLISSPKIPRSCSPQWL